MAQYNVTHSCGHDQAHQLYGKNIERESKIEWFQTTPCTECWKKEQQSKKQKEIEIAHKQTNEYLSTHSLPELNGSEKQIKWANDLRVAIISDYDKIKKVILSKNNDDPLIPTLLVRFETELLSHTSAKWWIDNRDQSYNDIMASGNPIQMLSYTLWGTTPKTSAQSLLMSWIDKQPEVIGRREAAQSEAKRQAEEKIAKEKKIADEIEESINAIDWQTLDLRTGNFIYAGKKINLALVNLAYYRTNNFLKDAGINPDEMRSQDDNVRELIHNLEKTINEHAALQISKLLSQDISITAKPEHTDQSETNPAFKILTSTGYAEGWMQKNNTQCHITSLDEIDMVNDLMDDETKQNLRSLKNKIITVINENWDLPITSYRKPGTNANPNGVTNA